MVKTPRVVVCGMKGVGKTTILEEVIYGNKPSENYSTIEDIYIAAFDTDRGVKERITFYDTAGIENHQANNTANSSTQNHPVLRHYFSIADGYIFVYDSEVPASLDVIVSLKREIDKSKDKKEVVIIVIGNITKKIEDNCFESTVSKASAWCNREKIRHFSISDLNRLSLCEAFSYLAIKLAPPPSKSSFTQLTMGRKVLLSKSHDT